MFSINIGNNFALANFKLEFYVLVRFEIRVRVLMKFVREFVKLFGKINSPKVPADVVLHNEWHRLLLSG